MAVTFITYLWHYLVTRLVYDQLLRPLAHDAALPVLLLILAVVGALMILRWRQRRRSDSRRSP